MLSFTSSKDLVLHSVRGNFKQRNVNSSVIKLSFHFSFKIVYIWLNQLCYFEAGVYLTGEEVKVPVYESILVSSWAKAS
jgi:hypothetical protein